MTGETKTEAIRVALQERKSRLRIAGGKNDTHNLLDILERDIWSKIPEHLKGQGIAYLPVDELLGFGADGV